MRQQHKDTEQTFPETRGHGYQYQTLPDGQIAVDDPTAGMVTSVPVDKIPAGSWYRLRNARTRSGWMGRRPGTREIGVKPDSQPIIRLVTFVNEAGDVSVVRLTPTSAYVSPGGGLWNPVSSDLNGAQTRPDVARMFDWLFFANGEEPIRVYRPDVGTLGQIAGAPRALTIANFADRIVAANLNLPVGGIRPSSIAWSENSDPFDWTGLGSGMEDLVQGQDGYGDPIQRLLIMGDELIILRKRSIWHAHRQPFAQAPMAFQRVISGVGTDLPHSAVEVEGAIIFADQRTKSVYVYQLGQRPQKISHVIDQDLFRDMSHLQWARASYDPYEKEYHLGICTSPATPWITKTWVYSLQTGAWSYDDSPIVSEIGMVSAPTDITTIDELIGTINEQTGTIDELSEGSGMLRPTLYKGTPTGEFLEQDYPTEQDWDGDFEWEAVSQNFGSQTNRRTIKDLAVKVVTETESDITLEHSIDAVLWRNTKTNTFPASPTQQNARLPRKLTTGPRLFWRIRSSRGLIKLYGYWMRVLEKGLQR